ncbi:hypothetical protein B0H10DRAFT_1797851 [Mycena sp. CBHHK59/15]|nr:hypothetical protein B0H10DRAFT_1797851 [Mycena sp. CBHHK59/15]
MDIVGEDGEDTTHTDKRRRVSGCTRACAATQSSLPSSIVEKLWFPDGDIVLEIESRLLKVHRKRLQCSVIFSDMLGLPQPSEVEQIDGCASVALVGDTLADWQVALSWIYHPNDFLGQAITFDILSGALRISTKYEIADLHLWTVEELCSRWPIDVLNMRLNALPHAAEAIALARECNIPEILPAAFYALSVQKFRCSADGGHSHNVLSPADLRRLLAGREILQDILVRIVIDPLHENGCYNNADCGQCAPRRAEYWRTRLAPDVRSGNWIKCCGTRVSQVHCVKTVCMTISAR